MHLQTEGNTSAEQTKPSGPTRAGMHLSSKEQLEVMSSSILKSRIGGVGHLFFKNRAADQFLIKLVTFELIAFMGHGLS